MNGDEAVKTAAGTTNAAGPYTIYSAGGLFTQDELSTNILIKEAVLEMESPYPPEYQERVYQAVRHSTGSGFDEILPESELEKIIRKLRENGTL